MTQPIILKAVILNGMNQCHAHDAVNSIVLHTFCSDHILLKNSNIGMSAVHT